MPGNRGRRGSIALWAILAIRRDTYQGFIMQNRQPLAQRASNPGALVTPRHVRPLKRLWTILCLLSCIAGLAAQTIDLREQISLNGTWTQGGQVPVYIGFTITPGTTYVYERSVAVPSSWAGKIIKLAFRSVNYSCAIFINGTQRSSFIGGWVPFDVDVTPWVSAGQTFTLRVEVKGPGDPPVQINNVMQWPVGGEWRTPPSTGRYAGIAEEVYLRAYGPVYLADAFVQTSIQTNTIKVDYTITNASAQSRTVTIQGDISPAAGGGVVKTLSSSAITIAAGATQTISVNSAWANAALWWPDQPNLYLINSRVVEASTTLDKETRRFGFREIWISGTKFVLNGVRLNLRGDNIPTNRMPTSEAAWSARVDRMKVLNMNYVRFHMCPTPEFAMAIADEKGFMIVNESFVYGSNDQSCNNPTYFNNAKTLWPYWIKGARNHPSVITWSVANEALNLFDVAKTQAVAALTKQLDPTRPVGVDERESWAPFNLDIENEHYPEGYTNKPSGSIYNWASYIRSKPVEAGEIFFHGSRTMDIDMQWWQGTFCRGLRYTNWAGIRNYFTNAWDSSSDPAFQGQITNLTNSFNAVALFDKAYDDLGIQPVKNGFYPSLSAGANISRTLILYNDEYRDTAVTVQVEVKSGSTSYAIGTANYTLTLGEHLDIPCSFQVPNVGGGAIDLVLSTKKGGVTRFSEAKRFTVTGSNSGSSSNVVSLGGGGPVNQTPTANASSLSTTQNASATVTLSGTDPENDPLTFTIASQPAHGSASLSGAVVTYTPTSGYNGADQFTFSVSDNHGNTSLVAGVQVTVTPLAGAPVIVSQPTPSSTVVDQGGSVSFSLNANGTAPLNYQWKRNGSTNVGNNSSTLMISNASAADTGNYACTVSNAIGSTTSLSATLTVTPPIPVGSYQQDAGSDGLLVIEAESPLGTRSAFGGQSWQSVSNPAGYSGSGAVQAAPNNGSQFASNYVNNSPGISYPVVFTKTGTLYLWIRGLAATTADNSLHITLDNATASTSENLTLAATNAYVWGNTDASTGGVLRTFNVSSIGAHTLSIWMREDGLVVDKLLISSNAGYIPTGSGPAESPTTGGTFPKLGDINGDGQVNILDLDLVKGHFGQVSTDIGWDVRADLDNNLRVDASDLGIVVRNQGL